jgi:type IV secretory pathway VirD2 relaxase
VPRGPDNERFRPRPGKPRAGKVGRRFTSQVLRAAQKAAGGVRSRFAKPSRRGGEMGRGRTVARLLAGGARAHDRRVVVKVRLVVLARAAPGSTAAHLRYIQRDGVTPEGEPGAAYGATVDRADAEAFDARGREDRHQFRFIVSPEDATELGDLRGFTRDLMGRMEGDLGTRLDWIAVDHFDTDNPHSHLVLRGVDDQGRDLIIARDYISHGMRQRASLLATELLGPQTEQELRDRLTREINAERWTGLDRRLQDLARDGIVAFGPGEDPALAGRAGTLERLGLAGRMGSGRWRLREDLEPTLRAMGERGDIVRTLQRAFAGESRPLEILHDAGAPGTTTGRIVRKGLADELNDRGFLVIDGLDGKGRYVALPPGAVLADYPQSAVVSIRTVAAGPRPADRAIAAVAEGDLYRPDRHLISARADAGPTDDPEGFVAAHVRRLEALRRAGVVERLDDRRWRLPPDFLKRTAAHEAGRFGGVQVEVLSDGPLSRQARLLGVTWLDRALVEDVRPSLTGFGGEVRQALDERRAFLTEHGLATQRGSRWKLAPDLLGTLRRRELEAIGAHLAAETGMAHRPTVNGDVIRGAYRRQLNLVSGRFAMIDDGMGFSLVPWRPVLENRLGQTVSGQIRGASVQWTFGRSRGVGV